MKLKQWNYSEKKGERKAVQKGLLSIKDAAAQLGISEVAFQQKMSGK